MSEAEDEKYKLIVALLHELRIIVIVAIGTIAVVSLILGEFF